MSRAFSAGACEILVGRGLLSALPGVLGQRCPAHSYAVIADHHVAELHGPRLLRVLGEARLNARLFTFPAGEWNKTREHWAELTDRMIAVGIGRDGAVIAFGGGVTGDLAGFVAATYLRGVRFVTVPTTLLAMIDASVGGKTGVDVPAGKNLVGAFHSPSAVVADVELLATLSRPQLAAGMAEAIKHGVIADARYFASLEDAKPVFARDPETLERLVCGSVEIKAAIVRRDEREAGERQVLNFGHTIGHALEAAVGYSLLHGEAIGIGMVVEASLSEALGLAEPGLKRELVSALERYGLPTRLPEDLAADAVIERMARDKKVRAGAPRFALPKSLGMMARSHDGAWTVEVGEELIRQALDSGR